MNCCPSPPCASRAPGVRLDPDPHAWPDLLGAFLAEPGGLDADAKRFREQLALPTDRPIVMGGHQAQLWHPGILAKLLSANALADQTGAAVAWLVVDFDEFWPFSLEIPAIDDRSRLRRFAWSIDADASPTGMALDRPATPAVAPRLKRGWTLPDAVRERTDAIVRAMNDHARAPNAAEQVTDALFDLLEPVAPRPIVVHASRLAQTDLFARVVERMRRRPQTVRSLYNDALSHHPEADVRELTTRFDGALEMPLWRRVDGHRMFAYETDLADAPVADLLPRGMLMTGMVRLAGCDLFVHGLGGRAYEPINDRWVARWLEAPRLAPFVAATADLTLALDGPLVDERDAARARWRAHHARHHPGDLGDAPREAARDELVARIALAPRRSAQRAALFARLHKVVDEAARAHPGALDDLDRDAAELTRAASERPVRDDRAWAAALHAPERLRALRCAIEARFA